MDYREWLLEIVFGPGAWSGGAERAGGIVDVVTAPSVLVAVGLSLAVTGTLMLAARRRSEAVHEGIGALRDRLRRMDCGVISESHRTRELRRLRLERQAKVAEVPCLGAKGAAGLGDD